MSTVLAAGQLVQLRVWTQWGGAVQAAVNTSWYLVSGVGSPAATDADVASFMDNLIAPFMKPLIHNVSRYQGVQAIICSGTAPNKAVNVPASAITNAGVGTGGAVPMAGQVCGILRFQTILAGSAGRGRWYLPFPSQTADSGGGSASAAYIAAGMSLGNVVGVDQPITVGGRTATLLRVIRHGKNKAEIYPPPTPVNSFSVDNTWATQKRRGSFGRHNVSPI